MISVVTYPKVTEGLRKGRFSMKASIVATALVLTYALAVGLAAQAQQKEHSMSGCVAKSADGKTFRLTNVEKVNNVDIAESKADLAPHVGHKVEITGTAVPGKETHTMNVTAVKMISTTCP